MGKVAERDADESLSKENDAASTNGGLPSSSSAAQLVAEDSSERAVTGVLTSHPLSRDVHIESFTLLFHGHELLQDAGLELNYGRLVASRSVRSFLALILL